MTLEKASRTARLEIPRLLKRLNSDKYLVILKALPTTPMIRGEERGQGEKYGVAYGKNVSTPLSKLVEMDRWRRRTSSTKS